MHFYQNLNIFSLFPSIASSKHPIQSNKLQLILLNERGGFKGSSLYKLLTTYILLGQAEASRLSEEKEQVSMRFRTIFSF